ncbi:hypothetical protein RHMOL_Rhmol11G0215400 [Rhododendron molle]|uniref:Uncharacterized protein n=2 Tax=Rhododendron molle TaxID=49168 RepID=A0ACC0LWF9_RHOML|nr:hypothetical protein RHMOL_Rhmol11G0215400 [Rhododendron molle]KAI8532453.1 hypothetical protein RHMOL_Rhmol11G0215400 [Rhododendron molle]
MEGPMRSWGEGLGDLRGSGVGDSVEGVGHHQSWNLEGGPDSETPSYASFRVSRGLCRHHAHPGASLAPGFLNSVEQKSLIVLLQTTRLLDSCASPTPENLSIVRPMLPKELVQNTVHEAKTCWEICISRCHTAILFDRLTY